MRRRFEPDVLVLDGLDLDIAPGQFLAVLGPSGSGKSTLLRLIAGLDRPDMGTVTVGEDNAGGVLSSRTPGSRSIAHASPVACVFQDAHLLPWRSVLTNVTLPLELMGIPVAERTDAAVEAIRQVGLADAIHRYANQLSGGMRMRVSLARALVTRPRLLLLDEPFAALDEITRHVLDEQLRELWITNGMTVIFVTHSTYEAAFLAERAVVLSRGPARVVLDRAIDLPPARSQATRADPVFAREAAALYDALRGEDR